LVECLMTCAISHQVYKTKCYSVNWFKNTRTCYLHTTETDINNLKVTTASDFFLNNCAGIKYLNLIILFAHILFFIFQKKKKKN
ncbi:Uncharacterized protein BM_BM2491, partial [Brugia malayi]